MTEPPDIRLFGVIFLVWQAANYLPVYPVKCAKLASSRKSPRWEALVLLRGVLAGGLVCAAASWHGGWALGLFTFAACFSYPVVRGWFVPEKRLAECEVLANLLFAASAAKLVGWAGAAPSHLLTSLASRVPHLAGYAISLGLLIFAVRGGTYIVRGVLACGGTMPPSLEVPDGQTAAQTPTVRAELNHGRLIGDVERVILALLVANGQFASLAFFFAAKGLIRSKDLELRAWADYLLLGSLTSFLTALVVGMLIGKAMR